MKGLFIRIATTVLCIFSASLCHAGCSGAMVNHQLLRYDRSMTVVHLGDSHVAGKSFPYAVRDTIRPKRYHIVAKNGVRLDWFLNRHVYNRVKALRPDLIILSVGTNDAVTNISMSIYSGKLQRFMELYSGIASNVLISTPVGFYRNGRVYPHTDTIIASEAVFGALRGYPVWVSSYYHPVSWYRVNGMMQKDGIHFTPRGYRTMGTQLGMDIICQ